MLHFYKNIKKIDRDKWNLFVKNHPHSNFFQSFEYYDFIEKQDHNEAFAYFVESDQGDCLTFCTGSIIDNGKSLGKVLSKRAIIFGCPLLDEKCDKNEVLAFFIQNIQKKLYSKAIYIEIRNFTENTIYDGIFKNNNWDFIPYQNYINSLTTEEDMLNAFDAERRRQIRKGLKEGARASFDKTDKNIQEVYNLLKNVYREHVHKPIYELNFFQNLMDLQRTGLVAVWYNNKLIAGGFFVYDQNTIYNWYRVGIYDEACKHIYGSVLADWFMMQYGLELKLKNFDFMGAGIKGVPYGVRTYKKRFGGQLIDNGRYRKVLHPHIFKIAEKGLHIVYKVLKH